MIAILFISTLLLMLMGAPVAVALGGGSLIFVMISGQVPDLVVLHRMVGGVDSFPLLAVPFFILAGNLMNSSGITNRIFEFAKAVVGWLPGGLGHVNVGASVVFAGMSGAAVADAGGLGSIEIKAMKDAGYDTEFSVGITAASSTIGPIIPPSLPMVIYGVLASASIGKLFAAGFVPGLLMALSLMVMIAVIARKRRYPVDAAFRISNLTVRTKEAFLSLMTPVIVAGGIITGILTPTEAAIAATAYALFLGLIVYQSLNFKRLLWVSLRSIETTAVVLFVVAAASIFAWILTSNNVAVELSNYLLELTDSKAMLTLIILALLLVVGVIMVLTLMISLLTPPVGVVLYVLSSISGLTFERCVAATMPFLVPLIAVLLLVAFVPQISLWLPNLVFQ